MRCGRLVLVLTAALLGGAVPAARAQTDTGTIDGRVLDEQKAAVPGATVTAKNTATGLVRSAVSAATGTFRLEALPAGNYDVTAELQSFAIQLHKGVTVQVGQATSVEFTMKVGAVTETITVSGEAPLIQTTKSDVGQVITSRLVENIPLNGRKFQDLSLLVPGTRPSNYYDPTKTEVGGISYGGLTGRSVIINVDGGDNNDGVVRGLLQQYSAEAIQEYKVTTQRYSAEFGRSVGGVVNVITKSGTNEFHGSVIGVGRNDALNATTYFENKLGLKKQPFSQAQLGGSVGGPLSKDRAHFFGAYEWNRRNDFAIVNTNGVLPDQEGAFPKPFRNHLPAGKVDFRLSDNNTMIVRYAREDQKRNHDFIGGNTLANSGALNTNVIDSVIAKDTAVLGGSRLNEFLVGYSKFENNILAENNAAPGIQTPDFTYGANLNTPQQTIQKRFQAKDDFSFRASAMGDHEFKVGGEIIRSHFGGFFTPTLYGLFNFVQSRGSNINNYLNAIADTFSGSAGNNSFDDNWTYTAEYFQDDWKPNDRLTLNLGVRYEVQAGPYQNKFDTLPLRTLTAVGYSALRHQDWHDIGPRTGFAYDLRGDGKSVVRGGYGRYYDEIFQNITLYEYWSDVRHPTFFISTTPTFSPNKYAADREAIRNSFVDPTFKGQILRLTAPDLKQPSSDQFNAGFAQQVGQRMSVDLDYVHANGHDEIHRWGIDTAQNVNTRESPPGKFLPGPNRINVEGNRGHSRFDGVYVTGKLRYPKVSLLSTYAWSVTKNLANDFNSLPADTSNANWELDYGYSPNDIRHRFTTGAVFQLPMDWQYSTSIQANTGKPFNALAGFGGLRNAVRATDPATGQMFPRDSFRADGFFSWDMRVSRLINVGGGRSFELLFDVFNITDHTNFNRDKYTFRYTSSLFALPSEIIPNSQREAEFGGRFRF
jgi:outer membrane receptor protein involved in Fe transport